MSEVMQDDTLIKNDLAAHSRLASERAPYESTWREIDDWYPDGAGGFNKMSPGGVRGSRLFDTTHLEALQRFAAAGVAITTPEEKPYIRPKFVDPDLMKLRNVQLWCSEAGRRLYAIRHAMRTNFGVAAHEDWDQLGRYGTSVMWNDVLPGRGLFYQTLHLSECFVDVDAAGIVDTLHRKFTKTATQLEQMFGREQLTPKMIRAIADNKGHTTFEILHIVTPNLDHDADTLDHRRMPIASRYVAIDEKQYLRRAGYMTSPMSCSRHLTSAGEKYGRSPAIKQLPTTAGLNVMQKTVLRAGHKAVDPAILFHDDDGIGSLSTKPGGMNPGLVDEMGRLLVARMPGGENGIPYAMEMIDQERRVIRTAFLEEFYKILTDPNSRMTTTEVLEVMSKQGILVRPYASRYRTEKQHPVSQRDLDLALRWGQIAPFPPEVLEAGAWPEMDYENMLAAMARAEETGKTLRFIEVITPLAQINNGEILDNIDSDAMMAGLAEDIGIKPEYIRDPKDVAAMRAKREEGQQAAASVEQLEGAAGAYLDIARGNQLSEAA